VQAYANLYAKAARSFRDGLGAADGTPRAVEGGHEAIARRVDLTSAVLPKFLADQSVVLGENLSPAHVPHRRRFLRRADDVGKQDSRKDSLDRQTA
jgi:hypothetical protein